ncbi:MAG: YdcF family protein [Alphaproteobacteria bacterium]|jgi:uncharacterized SAM-binding protein YcdF (DUF218 family)|nr:YdcF family protein [Alphaproteobacteria bacterium]MDP6515784.1 YdcF family protein [Alphaproteobacteria bacterium]|tara:strand:+ start:174 stop:788 length:615 start_codon:yes stop_codon:yes gene_type:complete
MAGTREAWPGRGGRVVAALILVLGSGAWLAGLADFADSVAKEPQPPLTRTDAIVVLTGGSERIATGLGLLRDGHARKLFISGVYRGVDVSRLLHAAEQAGQQFADRITLGHTADDTLGNARETATWMAEQGFESVRLVTAAYHMPRSLIEFRHAMPGIELVPHPVFPPNVRLDDWWRWPGTTVLLASEYTKYLLSRLRVAATIW